MIHPESFFPCLLQFNQCTMLSCGEGMSQVLPFELIMDGPLFRFMQRLLEVRRLLRTRFGDVLLLVWYGLYGTGCTSLGVG